MGLLGWFKQLQEAADGDATCTVVLTLKGEQVAASKLNPISGFAKFIQRPVKPRQPVKQAELCDLPEAAMDRVWACLDKDSRQSARLTCKGLSRILSQSLRVVSIEPTSLSKYLQQVVTAPASFANANELHLRFLSDNDEHAALTSVFRAYQQFRHLHTLTAESMQIPKACFPDFMQLLLFSPTITRLHLPDQRFTTSTEQRQLTGVLESLLGLQELRLPAASSSHSNPLQPTVLRRIGRLRNLRLLHCDASASTNLSIFSNLPRLEELNLHVSCSGREMASLLQHMPRLISLELSGLKLSDSLGSGLNGLPHLQKLVLGFCPCLSAAILEKVR
jgi:hypothetical protein